MRLRELRQSVKLTQAKMADVVESSQSAVARYEIGQAHVPADVMLWYADYFDVSLDYIYGRTDKLQGKLYENKPRLEKMHPEMEQFIVLVWKLDRFARNRYDSAQYKNILRKNGVKVVSANETISEGSEGILMESILEGFAEYFSADLAEKVSRGMTENALKCKFNGGNPTMGYRIDSDQCFQLDPVTAPFVLETYKRYDEGATMTEIRDWLNNRGVKNTRGGKHTVNSVAKILKNRRYLGEYSYRDVVIPNGIPAIVSEEPFDRVQEKEDLEFKLASEKLAKPRLTEEKIACWFAKFRGLDKSKKSHRQCLIDTFVNRIYLYDDKLVITYNHKDGAQTIHLNDVENALSERADSSDLVHFTVPYQKGVPERELLFGI